MRVLFITFFAVSVLAPTCFAGEEPHVVKNLEIIFEEGQFGGWPANNGIWNWGDEIVVGFTWGYYKDKGGGHPIDGDRPSYPMQARSLDGGNTWTIEQPNYLTEDLEEPEPKEPTGGIDFQHPDFAMMFRMEGSNEGYSHYYYSYDRCKTWEGPFSLPDFDRKGIFARTDYIIDGKHEMMAFLTAAEDEGGEGWPFAARTQDGGKTWNFVGWIGPQPERAGYSIMPTTLRIDDHSLFSVIRRRGIIDGEKQWWIESFLSPDNGVNWYQAMEPTVDNAGNPAHMIELQDGRWVLTYGFRRAPYGIRAKISEDKGKTWSGEIMLRDDGGEWDLGYPRTCQRADGNIVTAYYFNDGERVERYIACTIWDPGE
jgi:hypothetical protein